MGIELPDTEVGRALGWVLSTEAELSDEELAARFSEGFLAAVPVGVLRGHIERLHLSMGRVAVEAVVVDDGDRLVVSILGETGERKRVSAAVQGDPPRVSGLLIQPGRRPAPAAGTVKPEDVPARIDELFGDVAADGAGCAVGVFRGEEIVYAAGYGFANLEHRVPITSTTAFRVGSVTKQFTAAAIALLVEEGALALSAPVSTLVPELGAANDVVVSHLVHHTSGIRDFRQLLGMRGRGRTAAFSDQDVIDLLGRQRSLNFAPGTRFLYSNSNYFLLGVIVARITGSTLRAFAEERIFGPLGMGRTHFHDDCQEVVPGRATGYGRDRSGRWRIEEDLVVQTVGQGNLFTTVEDLAAWNGALVHNKLGGATAAELMGGLGAFDDATLSAYGFGLMHHLYRQRRMITHGGATEGFRAEFVRFPDTGIGIACLVNSHLLDPTATCLTVADIVLADGLGPDGAGPRPPRGTEESREYAGDSPPVVAPIAAWDALAGCYYSRELDVTWQITIDAGRPHVVYSNGRRAPLSHAGAASLGAEGLRIDFDVDSNPPRFVVGGGRVFGIEFERQPTS